MNITRCLRSAAWASAFVLAVANFSCDALNPALVSQLGGDAGNAGPSPTGSIVLILNNQTGRRLALDYDLEITRAGQSTVVQTGGSLETGTGYWTTTFDCDTTGLILTGIVPTDAGDQGEGLSLAVNEFRRPALQCGSVVFVNVPLLGSPTADLVP